MPKLDWYNVDEGLPLNSKPVIVQHTDDKYSLAAFLKSDRLSVWNDILTGLLPVEHIKRWRVMTARDRMDLMASLSDAIESLN